MDLESMKRRAIERIGHAETELDAEPWREIFFAASNGDTAAVEEIIRRYPEHKFI